MAVVFVSLLPVGWTLIRVQHLLEVGLELDQYRRLEQFLTFLISTGPCGGSIAIGLIEMVLNLSSDRGQDVLRASWRWRKWHV